MAYVVTSTHPITLPGGRMVGPGETVGNVKASDPEIAALVDAGALRKKPTAKTKSKPAAPAEPEAVDSPLDSNETEKN